MSASVFRTSWCADLEFRGGGGAQALGELDTDGSGTVDYKEFEAFWVNFMTRTRCLSSLLAAPCWRAPSRNCCAGS